MSPPLDNEANRSGEAAAPAEGGAPPPPLLEVRDLHTRFGPVEAVAGVSFDVRQGETVAIVGESGSGKSVTAMSILRLIPSPPGRIVGGEVLFDGVDLLKMSEAEIREVRGNRISVVFQEPMTSLNPVLTIGRQIGEPIETHENPGRKSLRRRCEELLRRVRIPDPAARLDAYPHQFSGGMRQRAMIAMSLACAPRLIIADEPTTALDVTVQAQVLELLRNVTRDTASALILITHDLGVVARYAQRVNVMYAGRIVERGPARDIYRRPRHPYTIGLMESVPRVDGDVNARLVPIEGQPPNLADRPKGCPFHPRCRFAQDRCRIENPPLTQVEGEHWKACWVNVDEG